MAGHSNDDEDREASSIVFELGGRLDLPEDFSVAPMRRYRTVSPSVW